MPLEDLSQPTLKDKEVLLPYLKSIPGRVVEHTSRRIDDLVSVLEEHRQAGPLPTLQDLETRYEGQEIPSMKELMTGATEKTLDIMNPMPISGLGTIIGRGGRGWDKELEGIASSMLKQGKSAQQVVQETGYFKDFAGNWKTQISDAESQLKPLLQENYTNWQPKAGSSQPMQLGNAIKHNELFYEYPELASKVQVKFSTEVNYAAYNASGSEILINPRGVKKWQASMEKMGKHMSEDEILATMINHETNHAIQALEDLPGGSTSAWMKAQKEKLPQFKKELKIHMAGYKAATRGSKEANYRLDKMDELNEHIKFFERNSAVDDDLLYRNTLGEADAFWSQSMRTDPDVMFKLPEHYDPTKGTQKMEWAHPSFKPEQSAIVNPQSRFARGIEP